jgi:hypothetical protein
MPRKNARLFYIEVSAYQVCLGLTFYVFLYIILNNTSDELIEVRPVCEIIGLLDINHTLSGLSSTDEIFRYCGCKFVVLKPIREMINKGGRIRSIKNAVVLEGILCHEKANGG